jgi:hypothetical protein
MSFRIVGIGLLFLATAVLEPGPVGAAEGKKKEVSLNDLAMEVEALRTLHYFRFTPAQRDWLLKLARETPGKPRERKAARASAEFRAAAEALRNALVDDLDDDQIDELEEHYDDLHDAEKARLDDEVDVTAAARRRVPEVLRRLRAPQVASFLAANADDIPDPVELLTGSFVKARRLQGKEWKALRDEVADEVGRLVAGLDKEKGDRVESRVADLLLRVRGLKEEEFKKQKAALEKEAAQIAGRVRALEVLGHFTEYALAELLSNPQLKRALKMRTQ